MTDETIKRGRGGPRGPAKPPTPAKVRERTPRSVEPAGGGKPVDAGLHTRWVRNTPKRIREMERRGYVRAQTEDVVSDHEGYERDGQIENGDLVLMKVNRNHIEDRHKRLSEQNRTIDRSVNESLDAQGGLESLPGHGKTRGGKFFSIP